MQYSTISEIIENHHSKSFSWKIIVFQYSYIEIDRFDSIVLLSVIRSILPNFVKDKNKWNIRVLSIRTRKRRIFGTFTLACLMSRGLGKFTSPAQKKCGITKNSNPSLIMTMRLHKVSHRVLSGQKLFLINNITTIVRIFI